MDMARSLGLQMSPAMGPMGWSLLPRREEAAATLRDYIVQRLQKCLDAAGRCACKKQWGGHGGGIGR